MPSSFVPVVSARVSSPICSKRIYLYPINPDYSSALVLELKYLKPTAADNEVEQTRLAARNQVAKYVADNRLQAEADARGWELVAAVAVFRGWKAEVIEAVNS